MIPAGKFAPAPIRPGSDLDAYDVFSRAAETHALKFILSRELPQYS
jgi:hypothetical protein